MSEQKLALDTLLVLLTAFVLLLAFLIYKARSLRKPHTVAFFHPYCNAGGGGERVLWCAVRSMQKRWPKLRYYVYSGDLGASKEEILMKAKQRFGIEVDPANLEFVFLRWRWIVEAECYPRFTLVCQTLAGLFLGVEAFCRLQPEIFIDSMGYPLTLPFFKWIVNCRVAAYVHYPTISCDMIELVERREATYNNSEAIAKSRWLSMLKLFYYQTFAFFYGLAGRAADIVMVNGSWTQGHIAKIWLRRDIKRVFPPCDVTAFLNLEQVAEEIFSSDKIVRLLSIGQIRPEKNHHLQLDILKETKERLEKELKGYRAQLTIAGGCRGKEDQDRVEALKKYAKEIGVADDVKWMLNVAYDDLLHALFESLISIHTMWNEHFGISVVEGMAAGTIMLAHDSGGPQMDIVVADQLDETVGFLASSCEEYASKILEIINLGLESRQEIRKSGRDSMSRFSEEEFDEKWSAAVRGILVGEEVATK